MEKIPTALVRDPNERAKVTLEITPGCEWVFTGDGIPTRKWDGTCVMVDDEGKWWARREVKMGKDVPENFVPVQYDEVTGKTQGWEPIEQSSFAKFHAEALEYNPPYQWAEKRYPAGTYELIGPKINGNPERVEQHMLVRHASAPVIATLNFRFPPRTTALVLEAICEQTGIEGVVWHHPDGRMAKLKARDLPFIEAVS